MKMRIVWIILVLFMLSACSAMQEPAQTAAPTESNACISFPAIYDLSEYNEFIAACEWIPDDFIDWEHIAVLGEFHGFGLTGTDEYFYGIRSKTGKSAILYIDHTFEQDPLDEEYADVEMPKDVVSIRTGKRTEKSEMLEVCDVIRGGFKYRYGKNGCLLSVSWHNEGIEFELAGGLHEWPEEDSGISRILSVSDTEFNSAVAEIKRQLNTK